MAALPRICNVRIGIWAFVVVPVEPLMHFLHMLFRNRDGQLPAQLSVDRPSPHLRARPLENRCKLPRLPGSIWGLIGAEQKRAAVF